MHVKAERRAKAKKETNAALVTSGSKEQKMGPVEEQALDDSGSANWMSSTRASASESPVVEL